MATGKPQILALIPARGGSKRLPGKNLKFLGGKPLLAYPIEVARACSLIDRVILSTDHPEILEVGKKWGAETPFLRPDKLASDTASDRDVFQHCLRYLDEYENYRPDFVLNLRCTTPFKTPQDLDAVIQIWQNQKLDSVRSVCRVEGVFHPYWMLQKAKDSDLASALIEGKSAHEYYQSQMLPPVYRLNGLVDGSSAKSILHHPNFYGDRMGIYETPEIRSVDIDTELDFQWAEFLLQSQSESGTKTNGK